MATGIFKLKDQLLGLIQGAWTGYNAPKNLEYLVVAGGGSGGGGTSAGSDGGGGAGGLLQGVIPITTGTSYTVTVGAGGSPSTTGGGSNSVFGNITAIGGGSKSSQGGSALNGGSGAGGWYGSIAAGTGTFGQGNAGGTGGSAPGYCAGGGGGAGTVGLNATSTTAGNGGSGIASYISGTLVTYAGGGGGSGNTNTYPGGLGGVGGGGNGAQTSPSVGVSGSSNTGGGGGGSNQTSPYGGSGGSGIVIVRYAGNVQYFTGGTLSYANGFVIHTFYSSGTLAPTTPTTYGTTKQLTKSLRFRNSASAYLNRTFTTPTNNKIWTWSGWVKRGALIQSGLLSSFVDANNRDVIQFESDALRYVVITAGSVVLDLVTTQVFRDPAAWYHLVVSVDTTQATASNRTKMYVNGSQVTSFSTSTYPSQNLNTYINSASNVEAIGRYQSTSPGGYADYYLTEINFIDGQALTPSSFGYVDTTSGAWQPLTFTGTYGTNGFYLPFTNTTSTTTLGYDSSGNSNNWTTNNISLTAGATYDSMNDVPVLTSATASNYCTWNPLFRFYYTGSFAGTFSDGNLKVATGGNPSQFAGTLELCDGAYYEVTAVSIDASRSYIGLFSPSLSNLLTSTSAVAYNATYNVLYSNNGEVFVNTSTGSNLFGTVSSWTNGDVISVAYKSGKIYLAKNGVWQNSAVPASGTGFVATGWTAYGALLPYCGFNSTFSANFGQQPFTYTPPTGFVALNTYNM